jgi:Zn-finger protein
MARPAPRPFQGYTNTTCEFFPCHAGVFTEGFNCLFCYCPLIDRECPGPYKTFVSKYGRTTKDCSACTLPHDGLVKSWAFIQRWLPVSPIWDGTPQTPEKLRANAQHVRAEFDEGDIAWATSYVLDPQR